MEDLFQLNLKQIVIHFIYNLKKKMMFEEYQNFFVVLDQLVLLVSILKNNLQLNTSTLLVNKVLMTKLLNV